MFSLPEYADAIVRGFVLAAVALGFVIALVRAIGLRSFSKMTSFDFVITLATGSLLAGAATVSQWTGFFQALIAIAVLMGLQFGLARFRRDAGGAGSFFQNRPQLLMVDGEFIDAALKSTRVTRDDIRAKLRGANVTEFSQVRAVVLETTGDISVIHGETLEPGLLDDVEGVKTTDDDWAARRD